MSEYEKYLRDEIANVERDIDKWRVGDHRSLTNLIDYRADLFSRLIANQIGSFDHG